MCIRDRYIASSGLRNSQNALNTTANNLANVDTEAVSYTHLKEMKDENFLFSLYSRDLIGFHHLKGKKVKCKDGTEVILTKELVYYILSLIHI